MVKAAAPDKYDLLKSVQGNPPACSDTTKLCVPAVDPTTGQATPVAALCQTSPGQPGPTAPGNPVVPGAGLAACGNNQGKCVPAAAATQFNAQAANALEANGCAAGNLCVPNELLPGANGKTNYQGCQVDLGILGQLGKLQGLLGQGGGGGLGGILGLNTEGQLDTVDTEQVGILGGLLGGILQGQGNNGALGSSEGVCLNLKTNKNPNGLINPNNNLAGLLGQGQCNTNLVCAPCGQITGIGGANGGQQTKPPGCKELYPALAGYFEEFGYYDDINVYDGQGADVLGCNAAGVGAGAWVLAALLGLLGWNRRRRPSA